MTLSPRVLQGTWYEGSTSPLSLTLIGAREGTQFEIESKSVRMEF